MFRKILIHEYTPIFTLLIICLVIGIFTVNDYGESWDEAEIFSYADYSIQAYQYLLNPGELQPFSRDLNYYGPSYFMVATLLSSLLNLLDPSMSTITARHSVYFFTSLASILVLYFLFRYWMSKWAAFGAVFLFASQPLIWGHSFINPKDIPFMAFFLTSIYFGIQMMNASSDARWRWILAAGIVLGLTISVRVIGPLAGILVFAYALLKFPGKTMTTIPYYGLVAGVATYLTWPFLWKAPISAFIESLKIMSQFPFTGTVLFMGNLYPADQLPRRYFPTLLGLQLTEPALVLMTVGFAVSMWYFIRGRNKEPMLIFTGWFLIPALWIVLSRSALYDNARQLLFLWPPLFILVGVGLDRLMAILKQPVFRTALLLAVTLPGIIACIKLHPYEYIYYNSLIGGVSGAYRNFELDYWVTSFRESMEYLNENAEEGATIMVVGTRQVARGYARPDLVVVKPRRVDKSESRYFYILSSTRANADQSHCEDSEVVFTVERDGAVLSAIRKIAPGQNSK